MTSPQPPVQRWPLGPGLPCCPLRPRRSGSQRPLSCPEPSTGSQVGGRKCAGHRGLCMARPSQAPALHLQGPMPEGDTIGPAPLFPHGLWAPALPPGSWGAGIVLFLGSHSFISRGCRAGQEGVQTPPPPAALCFLVPSDKLVLAQWEAPGTMGLVAAARRPVAAGGTSWDQPPQLRSQHRKALSPGLILGRLCCGPGSGSVPPSVPVR